MIKMIHFCSFTFVIESASLTLATEPLELPLVETTRERGRKREREQKGDKETEGEKDKEKEREER